VGVALQCDAIAGDVEASPRAAKDHLVRMRKQVEEHVRETRRSIRNLRSPRLDSKDFPGVLRDVGERATAGKPVRFEFSVSGVPQRCPPKIEEQLLRIGQEAVQNAVRHAQATRMQMELRYEDSAVTLRVADDGRGFDVPVKLDENGGHYGLMTMKERADSVGASFLIESRPSGTMVETTVRLAAGVSEATS
jgi:signal transduction histidine kinase